MSDTPRPSIQVAETSSKEKERRPSCSSLDSLKKAPSPSTPCDDIVQNVLLSNDTDDECPPAKSSRPSKTRTFFLTTLGLLVLAWWLTSTVLPATRHRWVVQTLWAWFFVLTIAFRFVPASLVARPVSALWNPAVSAPLSRLPPRARLALGWLCALAITFGSAFGFARPEGTSIVDRVISLIGVYFFQLALYGVSHNRARINWTRVPVSIVLQQALALFVLKSSAGYAIFRWISTAVADFQTGAVEATAFIFDAETAEKGWFLAAGLGVMLFLAAWVQMLFFFGWMQWLTKQFAWFGQKVFAASGAETFVALWSPWFGQANSALLIGPYIEGMTDSEIFAVMATSMSSISSLMIGTYATKLQMPARNLIAQSAMVIPGSIVNAKVAAPEPDPDAPVTRSRASTHAARKKLNLKKAHDLLESLSDGAWVGLKVVGFVLSNFFVILSLLIFVNGILVWIFRGFGVRALDLHRVIAVPLVPLTFFLGVPRREVWALSYVLCGKLLVSADFAFAALAKIEAGPEELRLSARGFQIMTFALADTASLGSLGIQLGVMGALAPSRTHSIARSGLPALLVATFTTLQTAAIAASVL